MEVIALSTVYLSLGSNLGDRFQHLQNAQAELTKKVGPIKAVSQIVENPPIDFEAEHQFLNLCLRIETKLSPIELLGAIKKIENDLGREEKTTEGYVSRCIDIDIILYESLVLDSKELTIPHPHFRKRRFVLQPLNEIASQEIDPKTMLTIDQLFHNCGDQSTMNNYNL